MKEQYKHIGILGGGQLARMMVLRGHELGLKVSILSNKATDPAAQVTQNWVQGDLEDLNDLISFADKVDVLTFESEFINPSLLKSLSSHCSQKILPSAKAMLLIQDRLFQKEALEAGQVSTASFISFDSWPELVEKKDQLELPLVLKARRNGYDGKGTYILKKWNDLKAKEFVSKISTGFIAEAFIPFKRELAISVAVNKRGECVFFPLVQTHQEDYRCLWVKGPMAHKGLSKLKRSLKKFVENIKYRGLITFELFDSGTDLLINEIAPRVHNSGHYSWDALSEDQFTLHLKAILNLPLKNPKPLHKGFAMYNLLGSKKCQPLLNHTSDIRLHWYGKNENYPGRKMGHLNSIGTSPASALTKVMKAAKGFRL